MTQRIGFLGLGIMGRPMARNLLGAGIPLTVWNRSHPALDELRDAGAAVAGSLDELFGGSDAVVMMLGGEEAIDATLPRGGSGLARLVDGRILVNMGTVSPAYSQALAEEVAAAGGRYVEAPVSGSRAPAEEGRLVAMVAGDAAAVALVRPVLAPMCAEVHECGPVPNALRMKLAANIFLIAVVTGLAESFAFAQRSGLDLGTLRAVLDAGQMSSPISRVKTEKLVTGELSAQAAITDVLMNARLIVEAAEAAGIATPLTDIGRELYAEAVVLGDGRLDMVGVERTIRAQARRGRSAEVPPAAP